MSLLEIKSLSKKFDGLTAVDKLDIYVNKGEIVSVIGPNGAGKTTMFNMLTGVYKVTGGEIILDGQNIENLSPQKIVQAGIARTFQNIRLFKDMRVIENVLLGEHMDTNYKFFDLLFRTKRFKDEEKKVTQKAINILESIGLGEQISNYAKNLSYGDQRKLEIARAMATNAQLLILDEPAAGMNPQESQTLMHFIRGLRDKGYTILLIEHDMSVVMNISDRIYVINYGKKIAEGVPEEILQNEEVVTAYLGVGDE